MGSDANSRWTVSELKRIIGHLAGELLDEGKNPTYLVTRVSEMECSI